MCSLPSVYGPSTIGICSLRGFNTVAVLAAWSPPENTQAPAARISSRTASTSAAIRSSASGVGRLPSG